MYRAIKPLVQRCLRSLTSLFDPPLLPRTRAWSARDQATIFLLSISSFSSSPVAEETSPAKGPGELVRIAGYASLVQTLQKGNAESSSTEQALCTQSVRKTSRSCCIFLSRCTVWCIIPTWSAPDQATILLSISSSSSSPGAHETIPAKAPGALVLSLLFLVPSSLLDLRLAAHIHDPRDHRRIR